MQKEIKSANNVAIKHWLKLKQKKYRDLYEEFIVEGPHLVAEAQKYGIVKEIITTKQGHEGILVPHFLMLKLTNTNANQGIIAICQKQAAKAIGPRVVVLHELQDPGNVGTIIRSASAFGFSDLLLSGVDLYNDKVVRASQGAIFKINIIQAQNPLALIPHHQLIATVVSPTAQPFQEVQPHPPFALLFGHEGQGLAPEILAQIKQHISIPIQIESLNVAAAAAIILHQYRAI